MKLGSKSPRLTLRLTVYLDFGLTVDAQLGKLAIAPLGDGIEPGPNISWAKEPDNVTRTKT